MKFGYVFAKRLGTTLKKFLYNRSKRFANTTQTFFHKRGSQKLEENLKKFKWFYSWVHLYGYCVHSPYPFFLSSFLPVSAFFNFFPARGPPPSPLENVTAAILSYAVSHLHEDTGKLRKTCADTVGHSTASVHSLQSLKKWPAPQRFEMQVADRGSPIQVPT